MRRKPLNYRHTLTGEIVKVAKYERDSRTGKMIGLIELPRTGRVAYRAIAMDLLELADKPLIEEWLSKEAN